MKKYLFIYLLFATVSLVVVPVKTYGQDYKYFLGGDLNVNFSSSKELYFFDQSGKYFNLELAPEFGIQLSENLQTGVGLSFRNSSGKSSSEMYLSESMYISDPFISRRWRDESDSITEGSINTSGTILNMTYNSTVWGINFFGYYSTRLTDKIEFVSSLSFFSTLSISGNTADYGTDPHDDSYTYKSLGFGVYLYPQVRYSLSQRFGLQVSIPGLVCMKEISLKDSETGVHSEAISLRFMPDFYDFKAGVYFKF